ncbi:c-type cytochrome (plasmid) [Marivivens sp. LCG002]|uniref:c-type cytochrome n=1 Tax=Marivivens sp. LCG002 TaxID=3051171 RepID=UPI0025550025|nr:c-type cytochrome [Marivivens sp. LCG002]WIV52347.1 c-type cytochrome [Marivivens sp. LCG002]
MKYTYLLIGAVVAIGVAIPMLTQSNKTPEAQVAAAGNPSGLVEIQMPELSGNGPIGRTIFENACAKCHGQNGVGNAEAGPPLIHKIYEPNHHGDESFHRAVTMGVNSHHWQFGNMPAVQGLSRGDVAMVVEYIRQIQRANRIN